MAPNRSSMGVDRRESRRLSLQQDSEDDYDLEAMGVSDGFRPSEIASGHSRTTSYHDQVPQVRRTPPPRPSSTTKPNYDSFALRHDGAMGPVPSRNATISSSSNAVPLTRSSSVSTEMAFVRPESPYRGPSGPSHPYQMYPQESRLARTASIATTSTVPIQERSYSGPNGPTHPYGMYPQNTVPEGEDPTEPIIAPMPVGFPGRTDNYQRRLGPDGEEVADIIGPDGHTEQLPPYTQYPDEAFARKTRPAPPPLLTGAGGIGLATRNPEFASREDLSTPESRQSTRSLSRESSHQVNTAALEVSEKPQLKKWQEFARKKLCGIVPVWALALVGAAFILFGIILVTVLVILKSKHPSNDGYDHYYGNNDSALESIIITTMTTTFDAKPYATLPAGVSSLPTGTYQLPITAPSIAPASCLSNPAESEAWSCAIQPALPYQLTVSPIPNSDEVSNNEITLGFGQDVRYLPLGAQPPILKESKVLRLVSDSDYPERGPAWFFQTTYDKVVILPENAFTSTTKRGGGGAFPPSGFHGRKGVAKAGDKPWFCYWNGTLLEAFIYVNQASNAPGVSSTFGRATTTSATPTSTYAWSAPTANGQAYGSSSTGATQDPGFLPCYPKVFKLEERRVPVPESISPYCIQNIVSDDGLSYQPYMDGNLPMTIYLNETAPTSDETMPEKRTYFGNLDERGSGLLERQSSEVCGCVWLEQ